MLFKKTVFLLFLPFFSELIPMSGGNKEPIEYKRESEVRDPKTMPIFMATATLADNVTTQDVEGLNINGDMIIKDISLKPKKKKKGPLVPATLRFDAIESLEFVEKEGKEILTKVNCKSGEVQEYLFSPELKFGGWNPGTDRFGTITLDIKELKKIVFTGIKLPEIGKKDEEKKEILEVLDSDKNEPIDENRTATQVTK